MTSEEQVTGALDLAESAFGSPVNTAVNCAGLAFGIRTIHPKKGPHPLDKFEKTLAVNVTGTFNVLRLAAWRMSSNEPDSNGLRGVMVNTASVAAYDGQIGQAA